MIRRLASLAALGVASLAFAEEAHLFARDACWGLHAEGAGNCQAILWPHVVVPSVIFGVSALVLLMLLLLPASKADK